MIRRGEKERKLVLGGLGYFMYVVRSFSGSEGVRDGGSSLERHGKAGGCQCRECGGKQQG